MNLEQYRRSAMRTRGTFRDIQEEMQFSALELTAEAGEVANLVYKCVYQGHHLDADKIVEELGDVLWGLASMCTALGMNMNVLTVSNLDKLRRRYPNGFSTHDSVSRRDHNG